MNRRTEIPEFGLFGETDGYPDMVHCERIVDRAAEHGWQIAPHRHSQMTQLFVITSGGAQVSLDGTTFALEPHACLYIPAQSVHGFHFQAGTEGLVLSFPMAIQSSIGPAPERVTAALQSPVHTTLSETMLSVAQMLEDAFEQAGTFRRQRLVALAHVLLAELADTATEQSAPQHARLQKLDGLIRAHSAEGWRPRDYASALALTTGQLTRICKDATGLSASGYINRALMIEACRLLAFTRLSAAEIGYRLGFNDPSYFSKRFRGTQGQSPSDYRARFWSE